MSTKRPPIFTEEQLFGDESPLLERVPGDRHVANYFTALAEAARAKDAELIQRFVDHHEKRVGRGCIEGDMEWDAIVHDCHKAGFKPSKP